MPDGKICYIEIPAIDIETSADFYATVFGWSVRLRGNGARAFDDTTGAVSGSWVEGRAARSDPGMLTYIMVDSIDATLAKITARAGRVVAPRTAIGSGGEAFASFLDPAGNLVGLYEERKR